MSVHGLSKTLAMPYRKTSNENPAFVRCASQICHGARLLPPPFPLLQLLLVSVVEASAHVALTSNPP